MQGDKFLGPVLTKTCGRETSRCTNQCKKKQGYFKLYYYIQLLSELVLTRYSAVDK